MENEANALPSEPAAIPPFRLREWEIQPSLNRIRQRRSTVQLEPRIMHVLVCLAARPGAVLSRRQLLHTAWPDQIVGEEALTRAISQLRIALGDDSRSPRYIETIRGGGYRLMAPVGQVVQPERTEASTVPGAIPATRGIAGRRHWPAIAGLLLVVVMLTAGSVWYVSDLRHSLPAPALLPTTPLTSYVGREMQAAISPDGVRTAFVWRGNTAQQPGIYVKQRDAEQPLRITDDVTDRSPVWSPDGAAIAFIRTADRISGFHVVPALGGPVRRLHTAPNILDLDWSPDGRSLVFSARDEAGYYPLYLLNPETLAVRRVVSEPTGRIAGASQAVFSPDSGTIAFVQCDHQGLQDLFLVPAGGGDVRKVTSGQREIKGLSWTADGTAVVMVSIPAGAYELSRVDLDDGSLARIPVATEIPRNPEISGAAGCLVFEERRHDTDLWLIPLGNTDGQHRHETRFASSTREESQPRFSPAGGTVAFISRRSGHQEIWLSDYAGNELRQLTRHRGAKIDYVRWAPDGRRIAYAVADSGLTHIHLVDTDSGVSRRIHEPGVHENPLGWSTDGRWLYCEYDTDDGWRLQRMSTDGMTVERLDTEWNASFLLRIAADRGYTIAADNSGILEFPLTGGAATDTMPAGVMQGIADWTPAPGGIVFVRHGSQNFTVEFYEFERAVCRVLARIAGQPGRQPTVSPDLTTLILTRTGRVESDLVLVEDFR